MMKTPMTHQRISKIALLTCLLTLAGCATGSDYRQAGTAVSDEDKAAQLVDYCQRLREEGQLANAAGFCQRALEYEPTNKVALMSLARILEERKAPREAAQAYRAILVLEPENADARYGLGKSYVALEQYNLALEQLNLALAKGGDDAKIYNTIGVVHDQLGEHEAAQEAYRNGLGSDSANIPLKSNYGLSLVLSGKHAEGLTILRETAADPAAGVATRQALAFAYALAGDMAAAEEMVLIDLPPDVARTNLAYYDSLRQAGVGAPPPPPEPEMAEMPAMHSDPEMSSDPVMASAEPMAPVPMFDTNYATAIALADAEAAQRPWTEWGQLPRFSATVTQLQALHADKEEKSEPMTLIGQSPAEGDQYAMAEGGQSDSGEAAAIDSAALSEPKPDDDYLSSLERLIADLPEAEPGSNESMGLMDEPMETASMPGMEQPSSTGYSAEESMASSQMASSDPMMSAEPANRSYDPLMGTEIMAKNDDPMMTSEPMAMGEASTGTPTPPAPPAEKQMAASEAPAAAEPMAPATAPASEQMAAMPSAAADYAVQLGSYKSPEQAAQGWVKLQSAATDLLGDKSPMFMKADLGEEKGIFYRLRTSPSGKDSAKALCGELSKRGIDCLVVKS